MNPRLFWTTLTLTTLLMLACAGLAFRIHARHAATATPPTKEAPPSSPAAVPPPAPAKPEPPRFGSIAGQALAKSGAPLANVRLGYQLAGDTMRYSVTDEAGHFQLTGLSPGEYQFSLFKDPAGTVALKVENPAAKLDPGQAVKDLQLRTGTPETGSIQGRLLDTAEKPIADAVVTCPDAESIKSTTTKEGLFSFAFKQGEGKTRIVFSRGNYGESAVEDVLIGTDNLDIVVERGGAIEGRVRRKDNGEPITKFRIRVEVVQTRTEEYCEPEYTSSLLEPTDGRFQFDALAPARAKVTVLAQGFPPASREIEIEDGKTAGGLVFELQSGRTLNGTVVDALTNRPVPEARLYVGAAPEVEYGEGYAAQTDNRGAFSLTETKDDAAEVWVAAKKGYAPQSFPMKNVRPPWTLRLQPSAVLYGYVTAKGKPVENAAITAMMPGKDDKMIIRRQRTDKKGYYEFSTLPDGGYTVEAANPDATENAFRRRKVKVRSGQEVQQDFNY